ncbi:MAG: glycosyltransferase, partial [Acidobacteriota bacterium]
MKPRFSVIVPVHDDAEALRGCLGSLAVERRLREGGDRGGESPGAEVRDGGGQGVEILVVDDGSRDHPERVVADFD